MKAVQAWQTSDGRIFLNVEVAEAHERGSFFSWYNKNMLELHDGDSATAGEMATWLEEHRDYIIEFLGGVK